MLDGRTDLAVHSAKDMPTVVPDGLAIVAFTAREDVRDVFVPGPGARPHGVGRASPQGAVIGSSSLRRRSQLLALRPDLQLVDIRGNVQTRLRKLEEQGMTGTVLAAAGLARLGQPELAAFAFSFEQMLPAVGQGSLAIEARAGDTRVEALVTPLVHEPTSLAVRAERALMHRLEGGCQVPIAAHAQVSRVPDDVAVERLELRAYVGSLDGTDAVRGELDRPRAGAGGPRHRPGRGAAARAAPTASSPRSAGSASLDGRHRRVGEPGGGAPPPPFAGRPLEGLTVVVTRPREQAASLAGPLEHLGARVLLAPTIRIVPRPWDDEVAAAVARPGGLPPRRLHESQRGGCLPRLPRGGRMAARGRAGARLRDAASAGARRAGRGRRPGHGLRAGRARRGRRRDAGRLHRGGPRSDARAGGAGAGGDAACCCRPPPCAVRAPRRAPCVGRAGRRAAPCTTPSRRRTLSLPLEELAAADFITFTSGSTAEELAALGHRGPCGRRRHARHGRPAGARRAARRRAPVLHRPGHQRRPPGARAAGRRGGAEHTAAGLVDAVAAAASHLA